MFPACVTPPLPAATGRAHTAGMAERFDEIRRFDGSRIREGEQFEERHRALRAVLGRLWFLLIPLVGIVYANAAHVRPALKEMRSTQNLEQRDALRRRDEVRARVNAVKFERATVAAAVDTLYDPRIARYSVMRDSLSSVRAASEAVIPATRARIDSLRVILDQTSAEVAHESAILRGRAAALDSLEAYRASLRDSIAMLDERVARLTDHLYRLQHPKEFRGQVALVTGESASLPRSGDAAREKGE
jgi:hypothetical protein